MVAPQTSATPVTLTPVAEFDGDKTVDVVGGRGPFLKLIEALNAGAEVPHPLRIPRVLWVSVVCRDLGAAHIKGILNRRVQLGHKSIQLFGSHGRWNVDVRGGEGSREDMPICPVPGSRGRHQFQAGVEMKEYRIVVGSIKMCNDTPGRDGTREAAYKVHINTRLSQGSLECRGVVSILDPQAMPKNKFLKTRPPGVLVRTLECGMRV